MLVEEHYCEGGRVRESNNRNNYEVVVGSRGWM